VIISTQKTHGTTRDRIKELLVAALGGREAGVVDWVKERMGLLVKGVVTGFLERKRGRVSNAITPFAADIVMYQTRRRRSENLSAKLSNRRPKRQKDAERAARSL